MHYTIPSALAVASTLFASVQAHMIMKTPVPYGRETLNNSPLNADGSDFPCKQRVGVYAADGASNTMPIGAVQTLSFTGSAVHGGGSCQISLTTDKAPTKDTQWQVIHSIEGGCPARGQDGNLEDGDNDPDTYNFSIPDGIAPGEYTLAWTWFNRIGNREMYMNCAPVTVTAASKKKRSLEHRREATLGFTRRSSFPAMFLANIGNGCTTADSKDLIFPDPGSSLEKDGDPANLAAPIGNCGAVVAAPAASSGAPAAAASGGSSSTAAAAATSPASSSPVASSPAAAAPSEAPSSPAAAAAPSAASSPSAAAATPSEAPSSPAAAAPSEAPSSPVAAPSTPAVAAPSASAASSPAAATPAAAAPSATPASSGTSTAAGSLSGACSDEGEWNCLGGTSFQRCASGSWSAVQPMPAGVQCTAGQSAELAMNAVA